MRKEYPAENDSNMNVATSRRKALARLVTGVLATAAAGTVTATGSDGRTTTAGGAEVDNNEILFA